MADLKPCPFCGATPIIERRDVEPQGDPWYGDKVVRFILCECGASLFDRYFHEGFDSSEEAIAAWNRRAAPADKQGGGLTENESAALRYARVAPSGELRQKLHRFLNAAAGEGLQMDGVDADDLYIALFPAEYARNVASIDGGAAPQPSAQQAEPESPMKAAADALRRKSELEQAHQDGYRDGFKAAQAMLAKAEQPAEDARGVGDVRQRFERIKRLALDAGGQGALPVPQSLQKIVRECIDGAALLAAPAAATAQDKPVAWVRYRSDGGFEGPIMDSDPRICDTRRSFWSPLYAAPQAATGAQELTDFKRFEQFCDSHSIYGGDRNLAAIVWKAASQPHGGKERG